MPPVPPVTSTVRPVIGPVGGVCFMVASRSWPAAESLDLGSRHESEPDGQGDHQPDDPGDGDVGPLLAGEGPLEDEQAALGEL